MESLQFMELNIKPEILKAVASMGSAESKSKTEKTTGDGYLPYQRTGDSGGR